LIKLSDLIHNSELKIGIMEVIILIILKAKKILKCKNKLDINKILVY